MDLSPFPWQSAQWSRFVAAEAAGRLPHALLLCGPAGTGIDHFARCLTARLLCEAPPPEAASCGTCRACTLTSAGSHPDFRALEPDPELKSGQISVEQVRELVQFIHLSSQFARPRVALIDPADALNRAAANALLKTLEEPPPSAVLLLVTQRPGSLPVTIRSRCQRIVMHSAYDEATLRWLERRIGSADPGAAAELLGHARGAPLAAAALAEDGALAPLREVLADLLQLRARGADPVAIAEKWAGFGAPQVLDWVLHFLAQAARLKLGAAGRGGNSSLHGHLQRIADELDLAALAAFYQAARSSLQAATGSHNLNPRSVLENLIVDWQAMQRGRG